MPPRLMDLLYVPALAAATPILLYQRVMHGKKRGGWAERFGRLNRHSGGKPVIWLHAVSLGEVNATRSLVSAIRERLPDHDVVISTTTETGHAAACQHYSRENVIRYPLDFSDVVRRVLRAIQPDAIVLMELEVWPNLITLATRAGIPVGVANGRVTADKSMRRFGLPGVRALARGMFSRLAWVGAQNETYAYRFVELGVRPERVTVTGSLKYDTATVSDRVEGDDALALALGIDRAKPLIVAGSTGPGEEAMLLEAYRALRASRCDVQLAIVPRKPERFEEVAGLIASRGFTCVRRSTGRSSPGAGGAPAVFLGDTLGELRKFYSLATAVFVGRSLAPMGGSDVIEVAALGKAMCFGPHMENFADAVEQLLSVEAATRVANERELSACLARLLNDEATRQAMGERARAVVQRNLGATQRTVELLLASMNR